jgi:putative ABC transport system permease protein
MDRKIISRKELNNYNKGLNFPWLVQMAWRDSRRNRSRLLLFIVSIILGIAALVAIYSLGNNLHDEVNNQAASLLGADLEISGNQALTPATKKIMDSLGDRRSEEQSFASMVLFAKNNGTRLIQVRALEGAFPYYGSLETSPVSAGMSFRSKQQALVDETLMLQYGAKTGDSIKVGAVTFAIAGKLLNAPGQTGFSASIAPIVYIPLQYLKQTGLTQKGSRISYHYFFKFDRTTDLQKLYDHLKPRLEANDLNYETVENQKEDTNRSFSDLTRFLSLVGFIALLLGCTGVASAVHVYIKEKVNAIAILRCLGIKASQAFVIYLHPDRWHWVYWFVYRGSIGHNHSTVFTIHYKRFPASKNQHDNFMDVCFAGPRFRYRHLCFIFIIAASLYSKNFTAQCTSCIL